MLENPAKKQHNIEGAGRNFTKALSATMVDLFGDAVLRGTVQAEFKEKTRVRFHKPYIPDGPPVPAR